MSKKYFLLLLNSCLFQSLYGLELSPIFIESQLKNDAPFDPLTQIDVLSDKKIEITQLSKIQDLSSILPNTNISGVGNRMDKTFSIRGFSNYVSFESSVAMYIDDIPLPFSYAYGLVDMDNLAGIELVKGSEIMRYGKSAQSAVFQFYTQKPTDTPYSKGSLGVGAYNSRDFHTFISSPFFNNELKASLSLSYNDTDGHTKNEITGHMIDRRKFTSADIKLFYTPDHSPFQYKVHYIKSHSDDGGSPLKTDTTQNPYSIDNIPNDDFVTMDMDLASFNVRYSKGKATLSSTTSFSDLNVRREQSVPTMGGLLLDFDIKMQEITEDLKYTYQFQTSEWLLGLFYSDKVRFDYKENQHLNSFSLDSTNILQNPDSEIALYSQYRQYFNEYFSILAGLRFQKTQRNFSRDLNQFGYPATHVESITSWQQMLPSITFSYEFDPTSTIYISYSKGYAPGGYSYRSSDTLVPFKAEKNDNFELGGSYKPSSSTALKGNIFYSRISDHVVNQFDDTLSSTAANVDTGEAYGIELEGNYQADNLFLFANVGVTKTRVNRYDETHTTYNGNSFIDVPNFTASVGLEYNFAQGWYFATDTHAMGKRFYTIDNSAYAPSYMVTNTSIAYKSKEWEFKTYAKNLFDRQYTDFMIATPSNTYCHFGDPLSYGVQLSKYF